MVTRWHNYIFVLKRTIMAYEVPFLLSVIVGSVILIHRVLCENKGVHYVWEGLVVFCTL